MLLRMQFEHHSLVSFEFVLIFLRSFPFGGFNFCCFDHGHNMVAALEERCSREVICRNEAIKALKKENETLEAEKARLSEEVKDFSST